MIRIYYVLTKPGIIFGNLITTLSGFLLASRGQLHSLLLLFTVLGITFLMGSACVFNNVIDRHADKVMVRTKNRPIPSGAVSIRSALIYGSILGAIGLFLLGYYTNLLTMWVGAIGFIFYVGVYSFWKYRSSYGTLLGSISGAVPPVVGYTAVKGTFDLGALLLFFIIVTWQMPHFYAIALYRLKDYAAASIPVLPLKKGSYTTKIHMLLYTLAFIAVSSLLSVYGYSGMGYLTIALFLGALWLYLGFKGFKAENEPLWARQMFRFSLLVVLVQSSAMALDVL